MNLTKSLTYLSNRCLAIAVIFFALLPGRTFADTLTGNVTVTRFFPTIGATFAGPVTIAAGLSYTCTSLAGLCAGSGQPAGSITVDLTAPLAITFSSTFTGYFANATFNGFSFSGLTFASGGSLAGVTLAAGNTYGLTASDISFTGSDIDVNVAGLTGTGSFTLDLTPTTLSPTPEPSSLALTGFPLLGLAWLLRRRVETLG